MEQKKFNRNPSEEPKEINDEELDQVSGGDEYTPAFGLVYLKCHDCGYEFEDIWKGDGEYLCGNCGSLDVVRLFRPTKH